MQEVSILIAIYNDRKMEGVSLFIQETSYATPFGTTWVQFVGKRWKSEIFLASPVLILCGWWSFLASSLSVTSLFVSCIGGGSVYQASVLWNRRLFLQFFVPAVVQCQRWYFFSTSTYWIHTKHIFHAALPYNFLPTSFCGLKLCKLDWSEQMCKILSAIWCLCV